MSIIEERDQALSILNSKLRKLSTLYKECYLSQGRGALLVYTQNIIGRKTMPTWADYRTKKEMLDIFDTPKSQTELGELIDNYDQRKNGVMLLITSYSNATFFVTFNF